MPPRPSAPPRPAPAVRVHAALTALTARAATVSASTRLIGAVICLVLGTGLLGGAAAGTWLAGDGDDRTAAQVAFDEGRALWREVPVDELFPPELAAEEAGPGGADRRWIRVAVAPDSGCDRAFDPLLADALASVGCHRLVRATYTDETATNVTTVGLLFTEADTTGMAALSERLTADSLATRPDLMPRPFPVPGTPAEDFGDAQRGSWSIRVVPELPVVAYTVTGFADGRAVSEPEPAAEATADGHHTTIALAGLGHDAEAVADRVERGLRATAARQAAQEPQ
ncbi:hypothetical protein [Streptomyces sp. NBC_01803]|uniref:hypothetical protein n=1 Tax=Streptomyces sp. NBC_01803 TaxID=2975946 RepID=UPI002DD96072|nr:hypothetical protein [Streptomyces sp. NBC_01803]WSA47073.1 hypothetical protein OIE51_24585 [Streptomyces sp. NBC_01803]